MPAREVVIIAWFNKKYTRKTLVVAWCHWHHPLEILLAPSNGSNQNWWSMHLGRSICHGGYYTYSAGVCMKVRCNGAHVEIIRSFYHFCLLSVWCMQRVYLSKMLTFKKICTMQKLVNLLATKSMFFLHNHLWDPITQRKLIFFFIIWSHSLCRACVQF